MLKSPINQTIEDYLRAIYRAQERDGRASTAVLARDLGVSAAAITEMVRRLADLGLLEYQPYQGAQLSPAGLAHAVRVTRRHRLWEVFLIHHLNFEWDEVHELAHELEHVSSDELIDRLERFLGNPGHDPHGDPIPARDGTVEHRELVQIAGMEVGESGVIERVDDEFPELLRYASSIGLGIKTKLSVVEHLAFDGSVRVLTNGNSSVISRKLASSIWVSRALPKRRGGERKARGHR